MGSENEDITTKFRVDISELKSGITDANKQIKMANAQFKAASAGMDDWSNSTEGLQAKIQQLEAVLSAEKQKLTSYQQQMQRLTEAEEENGRRAEILRQKHAEAVEQFGKNSTEAKKLETALRAVEKEQMSNAKAAEDMSVRVLNQQAAVNKTERELRNYNGQLNDLGSSSQEAEKGIRDIGEASGDTESKIGKLTSGLAGLAKKGLFAIGAAATAAVAGLAAAAEESREWNNDMIKLQQNAKDSGNSFAVMKGQLRELTALTGETDSSIEALSNIMATGFDDKQATQAIEALSGAVIKFPDTLKIESLADSLQETIKTASATGQFSELIGRLGYDVDDFNKQLEKCSSAAERQQLALAFLNQSGLAKTNEEYQKANKSILDYEKAQFDLEDSMATLGEAFMPVMTLVKTFGANLLSEAIPAVSSLVTAITGLANGSEGAGEKLGNAISSIVQNIVNKAIEMAPTILETGKNILLNLISGITSSAPQIITTAGNVISSLIQSFTSYLPNIISLGTQLLENITSGLVTNLPAFLSKALDIAEGFADTLAANAPKLIQSGVEMLQKLVQGVMDQLPMLISRVPEIVIKFANVINDNAPTILRAGVNIIVTIVKGIIKAIPTLVANIPKIFQAILAVWQAFNWLSLGKNAITGVKNGISSMVGQVKTAGTKILNTVTNAIRSLPSKLLSIGKSGGTGIANGIKSLAGTVGNAAKGILNKVVTTFTSLPKKMLGIGKNIVQGLWNGISNMTGWVLSKIKGFGDSVLGGIKDFFDIHSPSRVMRDQVGKNIALGVGEGIKRYTFKTVDEAKKMSAATKKAASSSTKKTSKSSSKKSSKTSSSSKSSAEKKRAAQYKKDVSALETKIAKENASISRQAKLWDALRKKYKKGTDERAAADKKYYALANKVSNEQYKKDVNRINTKINKEKLSSKEQAKLWNSVRKKYKVGTDERRALDNKYYAAYNKISAEQYKKDVAALEAKVSKNDLSYKKQSKLWDTLRKKYKKGTDERASADKKYYELVKKARAEDYADDVEAINLKVEQEELGAAEQLKLYKALRKEYKKGTDERKKLDLQIAKLENDARKEKFDNLKADLQKEKNYDRLSLKQEVDYWKKIRNQFKKGTDEWEEANLEWYNARKELLEKIQDIEDEYNENVKEANEDLIDSIQEVTDAYNDSVKSRADAITDSMSLFDAFDYGTALSGKDLLDNLQTQVDGLEEWTKELDTLAARGIGGELLEQLQEMGPSALAELKALNELTDSELNTYSETWKKKNEIATQRATKELEGLKQETAQKIQELTAETNEKLKEYANTYNESMKELGVSLTAPVKKLVDNMTVQGSTAVINFSTNFSTAAKSNETKEKFNTLNSTLNIATNSLANTMQKIGEEFVQSFADSFLKAAQSSSTKNKIKTLNLEVLNAVNPLVEEMKKIGEKIALGLVSGIEEQSKAVQTAAEKMINVTQRQSNLNGIKSVLSSAHGNLTSTQKVIKSSNISNSNVNNSKTINYTQVINSPKSLSRMDIRRQTKNALDFVRI